MPPAAKHLFNSAAELLALCAKYDLSISELMMINESAWAKRADITARLMRIWEAMDTCIASVLANDRSLPRTVSAYRLATRAGQ